MFKKAVIDQKGPTLWRLSVYFSHDPVDSPSYIAYAHTMGALFEELRVIEQEHKESLS